MRKQQLDNEQEDKSAWDARQLFTRELWWRAHLVLNSDQNNVKEWFEHLSDFFDWAACALKTDFAEELEAIEHLIYTKRTKNTVFTERERKERKELAYKEMRRLFRVMNKELWEAELYVPFKDDENFVEMFKKQYK